MCFHPAHAISFIVKLFCYFIIPWILAAFNAEFGLRTLTEFDFLLFFLNMYCFSRHRLLPELLAIIKLID